MRFDLRGWARQKFGGARNAPTRAHGPNLAVAQLEDRTVPSTYFVIGSGLDDSILLSGSASSLTITNAGANSIVARPSTAQAQNVVTILPGATFTYDPAAIGRAPISSLEVRGGDGSDTISAAALVGLGLTVEGGNGDDTIVGSPADDVLRGGDGTDTIVGDPARTFTLSTAGEPTTAPSSSVQLDGLTLTGFAYTGDPAGNPTLLAGRVMVNNTSGNGDSSGGIGVTNLGGNTPWNDGSSWGAGTRALDNQNGNEMLRAVVTPTEGNYKATSGELQMNLRGLGGSGASLLVKMFDGGTAVGSQTFTGITGFNGVTRTFSSATPFDRIEVYVLDAGEDGGDDQARVYLTAITLNATGAGNDTIDGGAGVDTLLGEYGDDTFIANFSDLAYDTLAGGLGKDAVRLNPSRNQSDPIVISSFSPANSVEGFVSGSRVQGTADDNVLDFTGVTFWQSGFRVDGGDGNDTITLPNGLGGFRVNGGNGDDFVVGSDGNDTIDGGAGNDVLLGRDGDDAIEGGSGANQLSGDNGNDVLEGGEEYDILDGGAGDDELYGNGGNDVLDDKQGTNLLSGGNGNDTIISYSGSSDTIFGGGGNDTIWGAWDVDVWGVTNPSQALTDTIDAGTGDDTVYGGNGNDLIYGGSGNDFLDGRGGDDTISGNDGNDTLFGGVGTNTLDGGSGNDTLGGDSKGGVNTFIGGSGIDTLHTKSPGGLTTVNLTLGSVVGGHYDGSTVSGVENVTNKSPNSPVLFIGDALANRLEGGNKDDELIGNAGNDVLIGGEGFFDRLFGGDGNDTLTDEDGVLAAHGGANTDTVSVTFGTGWDNNTNTTDGLRSDGKISGGYGNDTVTVTNATGNANFFLSVNGDEPNDGTPGTGGFDVLNLSGLFLSGSVFAEFEEVNG
jgi:Ca2+-binding RTX toxin-like protein